MHAEINTVDKIAEIKQLSRRRKLVRRNYG